MSGGTILVGTDGSRNAAHAARWAGDLAAATGRSVHVVHCRPDLALGGGSGDHQARRALRVWASTADRPGLEVTEAVVSGDPREQLPRLAEELDVALVVVGARGEGGFGHLALGRVATHVLHDGRRPVAVVPRTGGAVAGGTVVAGLDGSEANRPAVEWAVDSAAAVGGTIDAVFVHDPLADSYPHPDVDNWKYRGQAVAEDLFDAQVRPAADRVAVRFENRGGNTIEVLVEVATETDASMIVIGTRGHWAFGGRALGHVATQLPAHAPCPVVVVPHD